VINSQISINFGTLHPEDLDFKQTHNIPPHSMFTYFTLPFIITNDALSHITGVLKNTYAI